MAIYRQIHTCFWEDTKVLDDMEYIDRYFYLYMLTNPHVNQSGCYEISVTQIANESGLDKKIIKELLEKFEKVLELTKYCNSTKEMLILNFYKYNWTTSPKVRLCIEKEVEKIKNEDFKKYINEQIEKTYGIDRVSIGYQYGMDRVSANGIYPMDTHTQEKEKEKEKEKKEEKNKKRNANAFPSPDFLEILNFGETLGASETYCRKFYNYYEERDWFSGKTKIKDWKQKFKEWYSEDEKEVVPKNNYPLKKVGRNSFQL